MADKFVAGAVGSDKFQSAQSPYERERGRTPEERARYVRSSMVAGMHTEGGFDVEPLDVTETAPGVWIVVARVKERAAR